MRVRSCVFPMENGIQKMMQNARRKLTFLVDRGAPPTPNRRPTKSHMPVLGYWQHMNSALEFANITGRYFDLQDRSVSQQHGNI